MKKYGLPVLIGIFVLAVVAVVFVSPYSKPLAFGQKYSPWKLGLDLMGGTHLVYRVDMSAVDSGDRESVLNGIRDVIERRVNQFGVSEPQITGAREGGDYRLIVDLAGVKDIKEAVAQIGLTPVLDFREVIQIGTSTAFVQTSLTGRYVKGAKIDLNPTTGASQINIEFNDEGAKLFEQLTEKNIGKPVAIFLDNQPIEIPTVQEKISGGKAQITGQFTSEEARQFVERFNAGALPAPITLISQQTIGASLGQESLQKAVFAGLLGTLGIMLFMILYYKGYGIYASIALIVYILLTASIFKLLVTMSLAGIAGYILSIGMAVDANVLIFERTKEELKKGISKVAAVEEGFRRAWSSIRDSNISTLITAAILFFFTTSFVKGFALTLGIGVLVSMFSAITITRLMLRTFIRK